MIYNRVRRTPFYFMEKLMKLSKITLYRNTPFQNVQNTFLFEDEEEREQYFSKHYPDAIVLEGNYNFRRELPTVRIATSQIRYPELMDGVNYMKITNGFDNNNYYFYVVNYSYINDNVISVDYVLDVHTTFMTKNKLAKLKRVHMIRQSLDDYSKKNIVDLDLFSYPKYSIYEKKFDFGGYSVLLYSNCSLTADFGTAEEPVVTTSKGATLDGVTSPTDIYVFDKTTDFYNFMNAMSIFPWIVQNFTNAVLVPDFMLKGFNTKEIASVKGGQTTYTPSTPIKKLSGGNSEISKEITLPWETLKNFVKGKDWLLNDYIMSIKITDYVNGSLDVNFSDLKERNAENLVVNIHGICGYTNQLYVTLQGHKGAYNRWLDSLTITDFDQVPIQLNQGNLAQAKSAYSRELAKSRTISGRIDSIISGSSSLGDKVFNGLSLVSSINFAGGLASAGTSIAGLFNNEYEQARDLEAQRKTDMLAGQTVSTFTTNNAFTRKHSQDGIHLILYRVEDDAMNRAIKYVENFGVTIDEYSTTIEFPNLDKFWMQFDTIEFYENLMPVYADTLNSIYSAGVRFYKYKGAKKW